MRNLLTQILNIAELKDEPPVLIDIGASGQIHKKWKLIAKHSICLAFDADDRDFGFIEKKQSDFKKLFVYNCIVSNEDKSNQLFYLTKSPYCSSILKPNINSLENYSYADIFNIASTVQLKTISLSKALSELNIKTIDWFKADSQGLDLRLFLNLSEEIRKKIIVAEFEPGIINAYENEDKLYTLLAELDKRDFWVADMIVKGVPRISASLFNSIYSIQKLNKLLSLSLKPAAGWAEITIINNFNSIIGFNKREYLLGCLFSMLENQFAFAYELSLKGLEKFDDPLFIKVQNQSMAAMKKQLYLLKFVPTAIKRIKELYF